MTVTQLASVQFPILLQIVREIRVEVWHCTTLAQEQSMASSVDDTGQECAAWLRLVLQMNANVVLEALEQLARSLVGAAGDLVRCSRLRTVLKQYQKLSQQQTPLPAL